MYTKTFPILVQTVFKYTSNSGASVLYFNKETSSFSFTKQSKLNCRKVLVLSTLMLLFYTFRTIQTKLINHAEFVLCYVALLGVACNYINLLTSFLFPEEAAYAYTQLYRYAIANGNNVLSKCV
jgi:hypothetical protein